MARITSALPRGRLSWLSLGALFWLLACETSPEREAMLVVEYIDAIDIGAPSEERQTQVDRLHSLRLFSESAIEVRELCVRAHRALLRAEAEQSAVSRSIDALSKRYPAGDAPDRELAPTRSQLAASNEAIVEARALLPECRDRARRLAPSRRAPQP